LGALIQIAMSARSPRHVLRFRFPAALLLLAALLAGCQGGAPSDESAIVRDSAGVAIHEFPAEVLQHRPALRLADTPDVRIGVVGGAAEYQWTRPLAATRLSDGGFAVLEQVPAEIRVFDASGVFVRRIGREGDGPGEFRSPVGMAALAGDTLLIWDRGARRLSWFSIDGTLEREQLLTEPGGIRTIRHVALTPGGGVVVIGATTTEEELGNQGRIREAWEVVPVRPRGDAGEPLGTVPGTERAVQVQAGATGEVVSVNVQGRWWWGEGFAWPSERGVWTADQLAFEARHFDLARGLDRIIRVMALDRPFTAALVDSLHGVELDRVADPEIRDLWRGDFEGREYPPGVPPVASVFADRGGRVWIGLTEPPPERLPSGEWTALRRWLVFQEEPPAEVRSQAAQGGASNPAPLGILTLPPRSHPLWADRDGVLLVRNDPELDVAYLEWYRYGGG
jgi:hypothetical protein